jgi:hypothetical protein
MSRPDPAAAMNGVGTGHICDSCNRRIQHGDKAGMYVTWMESANEWIPRRTWCLDCCPETVDPPTEGVDEAIFLGMFFAHRIVSVRVKSRCYPHPRQ